MNKLIYDAYRFVQLFASSIEDHPLLIYLSALPFTPVDTLLFKTFAAHSIPWVFDGYHKSWPPLLQILSGHELRVCDIAFSPDGTQIALGSLDLTVRVWDVSSGILLLGPLRGLVLPWLINHCFRNSIIMRSIKTIKAPKCLSG